MAKISVFLLGDSKSLERAFARSEAAAARFNAEMKTTGKATSRAGVGGIFGGREMLKTTAAVTGGLIAYQGLTEALRGTIDAGREAAMVQRQLAQQLKVSGLSWGQSKRQIEESSLALSRLSGFNVDELEQSFTTLVRATGDVTDALQINAIAANVARGRHISLTQASVALSKAYLGNTTALKKLGVPINQNLQGMTLLEDVNKRFAGQAEKGATSIDHLSASMHSLGVEVGTVTLPALNFFADGLAKVADRTATIIRTARQNIGGILSGSDLTGRGRTPAFDPSSIGAPTPESAMKAFVRAAREVNAAAAAALHPGFTAAQKNAWFDTALGRSLDRVQDITSIQGQIARLQQLAKVVEREIKRVKDVTRRGTLSDLLVEILREITGDRQQVADDAKQAAQEAADKAKAAAEAAKQEALAWANFAEERAAVTPTLRDDLKAARAKLKLLQEQAGVGKKTAEEAQAIWEQQQKIKEILSRGSHGRSPTGPLVTAAAFVAANAPGLTRDQARRLEAGLLQSGGGIRGRTGSVALAGGFMVGTINMYGIQDMKALENELAKRRRARAVRRRGT